VTYAELGEYDKAVTYVTKLVQVAATTPYLPEQCSILKLTIHTHELHWHAGLFSHLHV
jgi:hypothetical protein